jgi:hypothetical protein
MSDEARTQEIAALQEDLSEVAEVRREDLGAGISAVRIDPRNADALPMTWTLLGDVQVILEAGAGAGGRWELTHSPSDMYLLRQVVESIVAGRVEETFGPGRRSAVRVTLADGRTHTSTGQLGIWPPAWGWKRRGRKVRYAPYAKR